MAIKAIRSISKVLMLASSVAYLKGNVSDLIVYIAFGIGALGYIVFNCIKSKEGKSVPVVHGSGNAALSPGEELVADFINSVLNYCGSKGYNVTLQSKPDGVWLSEIDEDKGEVHDLMNLSLPDAGTLTEESLTTMINSTCQQIDAQLAQLHNN